MDVREKALDYLARHNVMTLATTGPDGPWAAAVFYVTDGFTFYFLSSPRTRHSQNVAHEPRVAATIQEDYGDWTEIKGIQLEGECHEIEGSECTAAINLYGTKFPIIRDPEHEIGRALSKVTWYRVEPQLLYMIDNSLGLGRRDEVRLQGPAKG